MEPLNARQHTDQESGAKIGPHVSEQLSDPHGIATRPDIVHDDRELVAAQARDNVTTHESMIDAPSQLPSDLRLGTLIDCRARGGESLGSDAHQHEAAVEHSRALCALDRRSEAVQEQHPVGETGLGVAQRLLAQRQLQPLALRDVDQDAHHSRRTLSIIERGDGPAHNPAVLARGCPHAVLEHHGGLGPSELGGDQGRELVTVLRVHSVEPLGRG